MDISFLEYVYQLFYDGINQRVSETQKAYWKRGVAYSLDHMFRTKTHLYDNSSSVYALYQLPLDVISVSLKTHYAN